MPHKRDARFIWVCYCEIWLDAHKPEKLLHVLNRDIPTLKAKCFRAKFEIKLSVHVYFKSIESDIDCGIYIT